jgi:hypothetical protein
MERTFFKSHPQGILASAAAFVVYYKLLKQMSAVSLSFTIYIIPLVALSADYLFYGEVLHLRSVMGMAIIFAGIWLSQGRNIIARKARKSTVVNIDGLVDNGDFVFRSLFTQGRQYLLLFAKTIN